MILSIIYLRIIEYNGSICKLSLTYIVAFKSGTDKEYWAGRRGGKV